MGYSRFVALAAVSALSLGLPAAAASAAAPPEVPVAGTFDYSPSGDSSLGHLKGVIHAVRRVPAGTAVYYSIGASDRGSLTTTNIRLFNNVAVLGRYSPTDAAQVEIIDSVGLKRYVPMQVGTTCLCSKATDFPRDAQAQVLYAGYALYAPLPDDVTTVSVRGFFGATVTNVTVGDGLLEPTSSTTTSIVDLESGWPTVPVDQLPSVSAPAQFVLPLTKRTSDIKQTVRKAETPDKVTVDLGADVLFAVDSAKLTPAASSTLDALAKDIAARGRGAVTIIGHTDSTGSPAHNATLSLQRAQSVLAALKGKAGGAGVTYAASGKGENEPVADNATTSGRQLNRRVTVTYSVAGS